jgi:hypothetical protein
VAGNILLYALLAGFGAGILDISRQHDIFKPAALGSDSLAVNCPADIQAAMANIDTDSGAFRVRGRFFHDLKGSGFPNFIPIVPFEREGK